MKLMEKWVSVECFLVVGQSFASNGWAKGRPSVRITKTNPTIERDEVAIALSLKLPSSLFVKPALSAQIEVNEGDAPALITPQIREDISALMRERHGIVLRIEAPEADHEPSDPA